MSLIASYNQFFIKKSGFVKIKLQDLGSPKIRVMTQRGIE